MSIVCCKVTEGFIHIASDSISVRGYTQTKSINSHSKLDRIGRMIIGSCGFTEESTLFQSYCSTHSINDNYKRKINQIEMLNYITEFAKWKKQRTDKFDIKNVYILIYGNQIFHIEGFLVEEILDYEAIGAGMDYALASLYLGKDVDKAVETACELSIYCSLPIVEYIINKKTYQITKVKHEEK